MTTPPDPTAQNATRAITAIPKTIEEAVAMLKDIPGYFELAIPDTTESQIANAEELVCTLIGSMAELVRTEHSPIWQQSLVAPGIALEISRSQLSLEEIKTLEDNPGHTYEVTGNSATLTPSEEPVFFQAQMGDSGPIFTADPISMAMELPGFLTDFTADDSLLIKRSPLTLNEVTALPEFDGF